MALGHAPRAHPVLIKNSVTAVEASPNSDDPVAYVVLTAWVCTGCDVGGRTPPGGELECWSCGGSVVVTARPTVPRVAG